MKLELNEAEVFALLDAMVAADEEGLLNRAVLNSRIGDLLRWLPPETRRIFKDKVDWSVWKEFLPIDPSPKELPHEAK